MMARRLTQDAPPALSPRQRSLLEDLLERADEGDARAREELTDFLWTLPGGAVVAYAVRLGDWAQARRNVQELVNGG